MHKFVHSEADWRKIIEIYPPHSIEKMANHFSPKIVDILSVGILLWSSYANNWALTKQQAIDALIKIDRESLFILGGDLYTRVNGELITNFDERYDAWNVTLFPNDDADGYRLRGLKETKGYIESYIPLPQYSLEHDIFFAIAVTDHWSLNDDPPEWSKLK